VNLSPLWISGILWIAFIVVWSAAAKNTGRTVSSESVASRQLHQILMNGAILLAFVRFWPLTRRVLSESKALAIAGLAVQSASFLLALWARRHLGRNWSGAITAKTDHELVRTGPYRLVRHPIYTAMLGMLLGTMIVSGELHAVVAMGMLAFAYARKIRLEERNLLRLFGEEWEEYRRHSWALVPGVI